jgi:phage gp45-like
MKKVLFLIAFTATVFTANAQRWDNSPGDNTGRNLTYSSRVKTLASTDSVYGGVSETFYVFTKITAAKTLKIKTAQAKLFDRLTLEFSADSVRIVTFSTTYNGNCMVNTDSGSAMTIKTNKKALIRFIFDGTCWIEEYRSVQY